MQRTSDATEIFLTHLSSDATVVSRPHSVEQRALNQLANRLFLVCPTPIDCHDDGLRNERRQLEKATEDRVGSFRKLLH